MDIDCNASFLLIQEGGRHAEPIRLVKTRHLQGKCCGLHEKVHRLFYSHVCLVLAFELFFESVVSIRYPFERKNTVDDIVDRGILALYRL